MYKELLDQAKQIVLSENNFSISFLQRNLGIGWNSSARLISNLKRGSIKKKVRYTRLASKKSKKVYYVK